MKERRYQGDRKDFPDVGNKNFRVIDVYLRQHFAENLPEIQARLLEGVDPTWTYDRLKQQWVPLSVFSQILDNLVFLLGNPKKLEQLAFEAALISDFGGMRLLVDTISYFFRFVTSPQFFFRVIIPQLVEMFNLNKWVETVEDSHEHVVHRIVYRADPATGRRLRQPQQDIDSLLWFLPGVTASSAQLWKLTPRVRRRLTQVDLRTVLGRIRGFIQEEVVIEKDRILIGEVVIAEPIYLLPETGDGAGYFSVTADAPRRNTKRGFRILKSINVHTPEGEAWHLFDEGEIYCAEAGCSLVEYRFRPTALLRPVFRFWNWLVGRGPIVRFLQESVKSRVAEMRHQAEIEHMHAALEEANAIRRQSNRLRFLPGMEAVAERGKVQTVIDRASTILLYDIANFTEFCASMENSRAVVKFLRPFQERVDASLVPLSSEFGESGSSERIFATFPNDTGDGGIVALHGGDTRTRLTLALQLAEEFHQAIQIQAFGRIRLWLRCGIVPEAEVVHWSTRVIPSRIMKIGSSINLAKRLESAGKLPGLHRSPQATYPGVTILPARDAKLVDDLALFHIPPRAFQLPGFQDSMQLARFEKFLEPVP